MIGVFDSGFGGLTVLDALIRRLPAFDYFYLGDSARAPYGARSPDVIYEFTREAVEFLFDAGCPLVILACNTASARALRTLQQRHLRARRPDHRILGVVRPSAEALAGLPPEALPGTAARESATGTVAVLGTAGTIASDSYRIELAKLAPRLQLVQQSCPLWVPLVEEGELAGPGTEYFLHKYLDPILASPPRPERILLACTHYPLLLPAIRAVVNDAGVEILDQGEIVASRLAQWLARHPEMTPRLTQNGARRYATTDDPDWFAARAAALLGRAIVAEKIHLHPVVEDGALRPSASSVVGGRAPAASASPPKLLLDANIFRHLDDRLKPFQDRLLRVSEGRSPPLLWACPITFEEIVSHLHEGRPEDFGRFQSALAWMDRLCGNLGVAEDLRWVLRRGVFAGEQPYDPSGTAAINRVRRRLVGVPSFASIPPDISSAIVKTREEYSARLENWASGIEGVLAQARLPPLPGEGPGEPAKAVVTRVVVQVARESAVGDIPAWGPFRSEEEQKVVQRELIAFELSLVLKAGSQGGYNIRKHATDFNDSWLCAYPAAGYTIVTEDLRLKKALTMAGCPEPRVLDLDEGLVLAESWLEK